MRVSDVLTSKGSTAVYTIAPDATVAELLDTFAAHDVGALVVSEDGTSLAGVVSERDVVRKLRHVESPNEQSVASIMTAGADVYTCTSSDSFSSLMSVMTEHRVRHVPVVDDGQITGVLSIGDAVKYRMGELEFERDQLSGYVAGG
ncbi:CBS domain-containing protein [Solicola sp. PLA-1-18]|uniref:CBS domain-containing protein n=1 Tax=Solicola sp. PLA-1-18 TaxID=3380532 RepID=UPI003B7942FA